MLKKLGFGLMRLPVIGDDRTNIDMEQFKVMADKFLEKGFTYFDTAYVYHGGKSEVSFREAVVKRHPRDSFTVTTKLPLFSRPNEEEREKIFNESMTRLGVDYLDYYWLHALNKNIYEYVQKTDAFGYIQRKRDEGKIRHIGFSFHDGPETLEKILKEHSEAEYVQLQINYLDWEDAWVRSRQCYEVATSFGKPVIVMEPIKGGSLARLPKTAAHIFDEYNPNVSYASWAIRYCASLPNVMMVLSGMSDIPQIEDNISYMDNFCPLEDKDYEVIAKVCENLKFAIPCTACRYCTDGCPMQIPIPDLFSLYNEYKRDMRHLGEIKGKYSETVATTGRASDCIACGNCKIHCPQNLDIPNLMSECITELE